MNSPSFGATVKVDRDGIAAVKGYKAVKTINSRARLLERVLSDLPDSKVRVDVIPSEVIRCDEFSGKPKWREDIISAVIQTIGSDGVRRSTKVDQKLWWRTPSFKDESMFHLLVIRTRRQVRQFVKAYGIQPVKGPKGKV